MKKFLYFIVAVALTIFGEFQTFVGFVFPGWLFHSYCKNLDSFDLVFYTWWGIIGVICILLGLITIYFGFIFEIKPRVKDL